MSGPRPPAPERRDLPLALVAKAAAVIGLWLAVSVLSMHALHRALRRSGLEPRARGLLGPPPAGRPRLQTDPAADLARLRAAEDEVLGSYGWVDRGRGVVRIPIERAMELAARRGLPARKEAGP